MTKTKTMTNTCPGLLSSYLGYIDLMLSIVQDVPLRVRRIRRTEWWFWGI